MTEDEANQIEEALEGISILDDGDAEVNMALAAAYNSDCFVYSIEFEEGVMRLTYGHKDEVTEDVALQHTVMVALTEDNYKILFCELQDRLEWLVYDAIPKMRRNA